MSPASARPGSRSTWRRACSAGSPTASPFVNGWTTFVYGDSAGGLELLGEGRALAERRGDEETRAVFLHKIGAAHLHSGDLAQSIVMLDEALDRFRATDDWTPSSLTVFPQRGIAAALENDADLAVALYEECERICERTGERWALSWAQWTVGLAHWAAGDVRQSEQRVRRALASTRGTHDYVHIPACLELLGWVAGADGDHRRAATLFGAAGRASERVGRPLLGLDALLRWSAQARAETLAALGAGPYETVASSGASMDREQVIGFALGEEDRPAGPSGRAEPQPETTPLTTRQWEVALLIVDGMSNRDIAERLVISPRTAEAHIQNIMTKLGFSSRTQIVGWALNTQGARTDRVDSGRR